MSAVSPRGRPEAFRFPKPDGDARPVRAGTPPPPPLRVGTRWLTSCHVWRILYKPISRFEPVAVTLFQRQRCERKHGLREIRWVDRQRVGRHMYTSIVPSYMSSLLKQIAGEYLTVMPLTWLWQRASLASYAGSNNSLSATIIASRHNARRPWFLGPVRCVCMIRRFRWGNRKKWVLYNGY